MIVEWLLTALVSAVEGATWLLPDVSLAAYEDELDEFADLIGGALGNVNTVVPISESLTLLTFVFSSWLPAVVAYKVGEWLWSHMPFVS